MLILQKLCKFSHMFLFSIKYFDRRNLILKKKIIKMVLIFYLALILRLINLDITYGCVGLLENRRTCKCTSSYSFGNKEGALLLPFKSYDDCGINLGCEKANDCALYCNRQIREILGNDQTTINQLARDTVCSLIAKNQSVTGMENRISVYSNWEYSKCASNTSQIVTNVCCKKRCSCEMIGQSITNSLDLLTDFTSNLSVKPIAYDCSESETYECEKECRKLVGNKFNSDEIKIPSNKLIPNYNIFKVTYSGFQIQQPENAASELLCKEINKSVPVPGYEVFVRISTDREKFNETGKYLPLGRLCCRQKCTCKILTQTASKLNETGKNKSELFEDISFIIEEDIRNLAYDCFNTKQSCMNYCRNALGKYLRSDVLLKNQTAFTWLTTDLDIFSEDADILSGSSQLCQRLKLDIKPPGLNFYLRSNYGREEFPFSEDMHIGNLCCFPFVQNGIVIGYIPFNRCYKYGS